MATIAAPGNGRIGSSLATADSQLAHDLDGTGPMLVAVHGITVRRPGPSVLRSWIESGCHQTVGSGRFDRFVAAVHAELLVDVPQVRADRIDR